MKTDRAALEAIKKERLAIRQPKFKLDEQLKIEDRLERAEKDVPNTDAGPAYDEFPEGRGTIPGLARTPTRIRFRADRRLGRPTCAFWAGPVSRTGPPGARSSESGTRATVEELEAGRDLYRCCVFAAEAAR